MSSILIIEDDQSIRQGLANFLAGEGHSVESLSSGMEGVQRAAEGGLDVVILDLGLPDIDGSQALKMIRSISAVPVIVATARDEEDEIVRILRDGADDYVVKPFSGAQLQARIEAIVRRVERGTIRGPMIVGELSVDSTSLHISPIGSELSFPSVNSWPKCGGSRTAVRTRPLTFTCRCCAASWGRARLSLIISKPFTVSASSL